MKMMYLWIICSLLILGTGILCDRKLERLQAVSSCSENKDNNFVCTNGLCVKWSSVCDGHNDCSDGSDETKELCARYEYGTSCGKDIGNKPMQETPWLVYIHRNDRTESKNVVLGLGSIIAPNIVVALAETFWRSDLRYKQNSMNDGDRYLYEIETAKSYFKINNPYFIKVKMIYFAEDFNSVATHTNYVAVIVLANEISFNNDVSPVCVDWYNKYSTPNPGQFLIFSTQMSEDQRLESRRSYLNNVRSLVDNSYCDIKNYIPSVDEICIRVFTSVAENVAHFAGSKYQSLNTLYSNSYFLTGLRSYWSTWSSVQFIPALGFIAIKNYVPWFRAILNKHRTVNSCVLPSVEGVVYSYEGSHEILSPGTLINNHQTIVENCEVGYHKAYTNGSRFCQENGKWLSSSEKLCFKMCPALLSDSLDIKCRYNGKNANCSNLSIPNTTATPSCKRSYSAQNGQEDTPLELFCKSNGEWNEKLYTCTPPTLCVLPTAEGVVYTYEYSNEKLPHGTFINPTITVNENCEVGYYNAHPNSFRVCQRNGKWRIVSEKLCLKMCPPLVSDSLDIKCTLHGQVANCSNPSIPDTIASPSCKTTHRIPNGQEESPLDIHCQSNGEWNNQLYRCEPTCGKLFIQTEPLIVNGKIAMVGTAPWNVGIYQFNTTNTNYDFICGGTIISHRLVVSAAHCFWKEGISHKISGHDDFYKIAVGKYSNDFSVNDNQFTKIMNVEMVHLKEGYNGYVGHLFEDIAMILLKNRISFSDVIAPACIDFSSKYKEVNEDIGKIVGWGKTEKGIVSPILLEASLPYFNNSLCRRMFTSGFEPYVTVDKFCAGSTSVSGQRLDRGDSGAGLCFLHNNLYYLTGVASSKDPETNNSVALFTDIKYHINWIRDFYVNSV